MLIYAHGGLDREEEGLAYAASLTNWWLENRIYPVFFVWETGIIESAMQLIEEKTVGGRSLVDDLRNAASDAWDAGVEALHFRSLHFDGDFDVLPDGIEPDPADARFHAQMVYAIAMLTYESFHRALGRHVCWAFFDSERKLRMPLTLSPFGMRAKTRMQRTKAFLESSDPMYLDSVADDIPVSLKKIGFSDSIKASQKIVKDPLPDQYRACNV